VVWLGLRAGTVCGLAPQPVGGEPGDFHPAINPDADVPAGRPGDHAPMTTTDYLIDSVLVLLVLLQINWRPLTTRALIRPLIIVSIAVVTYLNGIPTAGNDLVLVGTLALLGLAIGVASGQTVLMRRGQDGEVMARSGWASGFFWVLGMGSRFAFAIWISHGGAATIGQFSAQHSITTSEAWTAALLAMAVFEVCGRALVQATRRQRLQGIRAGELA
jgi:hypothetical protein